jgi:hypothetical protein
MQREDVYFHASWTEIVPVMFACFVVMALVSSHFLANAFCMSFFAVVSMQQSEDGSIALIIASVWTGLIHLALGVLGTFVLKRFPTSFSVGFFLGVLVVLANQNIILFASFHKYSQGSARSNQVFATLGFVLFVVLSFMSLLLVHFKHEVVVTPMDGGATMTAVEDETAENTMGGSTSP